uniref:CaM_binding domain-containing protein n=1 Tax=Steinernema glaseri TaxID=37863 RepID=A0A1I8A557_9BILA
MGRIKSKSRLTSGKKTPSTSSEAEKPAQKKFPIAGTSGSKDVPMSKWKAPASRTPRKLRSAPGSEKQTPKLEAKETSKQRLSCSAHRMTTRKRGFEKCAKDSEKIEIKKVCMEMPEDVPDVQKAVLGERNDANVVKDRPSTLEVEEEAVEPMKVDKVHAPVLTENNNIELSMPPATPVNPGMACAQEERTPHSILKRREGPYLSPKTDNNRRVHFDWNTNDEDARRHPAGVHRPRARQSLFASPQTLNPRRGETMAEKKSSAGENNGDSDFRHIYPQLIKCTKPADAICKAIMDNSASYASRNFYRARRIKTIGDLARLSRSDLAKMPFVVPKVDTLRSKLDLVLKEETNPEEETPPSSQSLIFPEVVEKTETEVLERAEPVDAPESNHIKFDGEKNKEEEPTVEEGPLEEEPSDKKAAPEEEKMDQGMESSIAPQHPGGSPQAEAQLKKEETEPMQAETQSKYEEVESDHIEEQPKQDEEVEPAPEPSCYAGMQIAGTAWSRSFESIRERRRSGALMADGLSEFLAALRVEVPKLAEKSGALMADGLTEFLAALRVEVPRLAEKSFGQMSYEELEYTRRITRDAFSAAANLLDDEFQKHVRKFIQKD